MGFVTEPDSASPGSHDVCPLHDPLKFSTVALFYLKKKDFLPTDYVPLNDLRTLQPSLPLKTQENKYLHKPPTINSDRTWGVFFHTSERASFKLCRGRHLWPLFHSSAPRTLIALSFL